MSLSAPTAGAAITPHSFEGTPDPVMSALKNPPQKREIFTFGSALMYMLTKSSFDTLLSFFFGELDARRIKEPPCLTDEVELTANHRRFIVRSRPGRRAEVFYRIEKFKKLETTKAFIKILVYPPNEEE